MNAKQIHWIKIAILFLIILFILFLIKKCSPQPPNQITVKVNCGTDNDLYRDSLANEVEKLRFFQGRQKFIVTGECEEQRPVTITQNNITILGDGETIVKVGNSNIPVFNIVRAKNVTLLELIIKGGSYGIKVIDSQLVAYRVEVFGNGTGLCVIDSKKSVKINNRLKNNLRYVANQDCPRLPQVEIERLKSQNLTNRKKLVSSSSEVSTDIGEPPSVNASNCPANDPPPGCTLDGDGNLNCGTFVGSTVNICCSNFRNNDSGFGINARASTVEIFHQTPSVQCISNIMDNNVAGVYLSDSTLNIKNGAELNLNTNGIAGLYIIDTTVNLFNSSEINSNNHLLDFYPSASDINSSGSDINCNDGSSINTGNSGNPC